MVEKFDSCSKLDNVWPVNFIHFTHTHSTVLNTKTQMDSAKQRTKSRNSVNVHHQIYKKAKMFYTLRIVLILENELNSETYNIELWNTVLSEITQHKKTQTQKKKQILWFQSWGTYYRGIPRNKGKFDRRRCLLVEYLTDRHKVLSLIFTTAKTNSKDKNKR